MDYLLITQFIALSIYGALCDKGNLEINHSQPKYITGFIVKRRQKILSLALVTKWVVDQALAVILDKQIV